MGDLVEDVVVRLRADIRFAADTPSRITRRRGGSAANVASVAARLGMPARFVGRVGEDALGELLVASLAADGVDVCIQRSGRTGSIVVLTTPDGERTMLTDRGAVTDLDDPTRAWLDGVGVLHVPAYSLDGGTLAATTRRLLAWAAEDGIPCTIDSSSTTVLESIGIEAFIDALAETRPAVLFANADEAWLLDVADGQLPRGVGCLVLKRGASATVVVEVTGTTSVAVDAIEDGVIDTTGAGDAFAAGFLVAWQRGATAPEAARAGHVAAASTMSAYAEPTP